MAAAAGQAIVVWARVQGEREAADRAESDWFTDLLGHRFGTTTWEMELEVHPRGGAPFRVQDGFKVPNRLFKVRQVWRGRPHFRKGLVLPVTVGDGHPARVTIDWAAFKDRGGLDDLYAGDEPVATTVRSFVAELRSGSDVLRPEVPRPTATSHPPVEGVDYDTWVAAVLSVRRRMDAAALQAHYRAHGFPAGRAEAISATWYERVASDPVINAWYLYDQATRSR